MMIFLYQIRDSSRNFKIDLRKFIIIKRKRETHGRSNEKQISQSKVKQVLIPIASAFQLSKFDKMLSYPLHIRKSNAIANHLSKPFSHTLNLQKSERHTIKLQLKVVIVTTESIAVNSSHVSVNLYAFPIQ